MKEYRYYTKSVILLGKWLLKVNRNRMLAAVEGFPDCAGTVNINREITTILKEIWVTLSTIKAHNLRVRSCTVLAQCIPL